MKVLKARLTSCIIVGIAILGLIAFLFQCYTSFYDTKYFGGTDLRSRIVGSRLMQTGKNPYTTKWQQGMPETLCDPNTPTYAPVNGVTATPLLLWIQQPLATLPYKAIRKIWWIIQQALLLGIILFFIWQYRQRKWAITAMILVAILIVHQTFWAMHIEKGQLYIIYATWLTILFSLWQSKKQRFVIITGIWLGIGCMLRLPLGLFFIPSFFLFVSFRQKIQLILSFSLTITILFLLSGGFTAWQQYFMAMNIYTQIEIAGTAYPSTPIVIYPSIVEGCSNLTTYRQFVSPGFIASLHYYFSKLNIRVALWVYIAIFSAISLVTITLLYLKKQLSPLDISRTFLLFVLLYTLIEICQPLRMPYNQIQWLPALLVMCGYVFSEKETSPKQPLLKS